MALNKIQQKTIKIAVQQGFTFFGDSHFISVRSAKLCLNSLVTLGYLTKHTDEFGTNFKPTEYARDFEKYGLEIGSCQ